ncbi:MAG TPA: glucose-1-phosphate adenylyltransferase subunit GlgD [Clostridia bacterium]|nr:glucose-1-phosphate adenylyltransferase subunit GlgD [Clostridia bacterium]
MLIDAMGLILADNRRIHLGALNEPRALAAIPFGGRFRMIDFSLSNMVNCGMKRVGVVALTRYKSLMDHMGTGAWWDLDRMRQGLYLIPPYINPVTRAPDRTDAQGIIDYVESGDQKYVIISSSDYVANIDHLPHLERHSESGADMSVLYARDGQYAGPPSMTFKANKGGFIEDLVVDHPHPTSELNAFGLIVISRKLLLQILTEMMARGISDFSIVGLLEHYNRMRTLAIEYEGPLFRIHSIASYYQASMKLLNSEVRRALYPSDRPIYTKAKNRAPCIVSSESGAVKNVLSSDGCVIMGSVENSILFRGAVIGRGAHVTNSVVFQDVQISDGVTLDHVIVDKNSVIKMGGRLLGQPGFPIVIAKNSIV